MTITLNCDLGESYGAWAMGEDAAIMPHIDLANIACGFHAGDPLIMSRTLTLAKQHGVTVSAHPGYQDLQGFGRRSIAHTHDEIVALILYQFGALKSMALSQGISVDYLKPHGALYNDMMHNDAVRTAVMEATASLTSRPTLIIQATPDADRHRAEAASFGITLWFEAFADRAYRADGRLVSRAEPGAVLDRQQMLDQATQLATEGSITATTGEQLRLRADTLCVHGDTPEAVDAVAALRQTVSSSYS